jgi:hypothetical protein
MESRLFATIIFMLVMGILYSTEVSEPPVKHYHPTRISTPPVIDGNPDDEIWKEGVWESGFTQFVPYNGKEATFQTDFCILIDDNFIYVAIRAWDPNPDLINRRVISRDVLDSDNVGIFIDSYGDKQSAFCFGVSAGGSRIDWYFTDNGNRNDISWNPNWMVKTSINDQGWTTEMKIPFTQLRFKKGGKGVWQFNIYRFIYRYQESSHWAYIPSNPAPGFLHFMAEFHGLEQVQPRRVLDVSPFMVASGEGYQAETGNPFMPGREGHLKAGVDLKMGLTNDFTMDMTVNPDFGQVEADPSEMNLTVYETFFPERRPFFIEGRDIASFPLSYSGFVADDNNLFYSRRIGRRPIGRFSAKSNSHISMPDYTRIIGAAKVTGKTENGLSAAFMEVVTHEERALIDFEGQRTDMMVEPMTSYFIGRVQKQSNDGNIILGGMFTGTHRRIDENLGRQMHREAYTGGINYTHYFRKKLWMVNIHAAMSHIEGEPDAILQTQRSSARYFQRPDASHLNLDPKRTSLTGSGGRAMIQRAGMKHWNYSASLLWRSPEFEINDVGYMREADQITPTLLVFYYQWKPKGIFRDYRINFQPHTAINYNGETLLRSLTAYGTNNYKNYWYTFWGVNYTYDVISTRLLRGGPAFKSADLLQFRLINSTDMRQKIIASLRVDYAFGTENNFQSYLINNTITWKPANYFNLSLNPFIIGTNDHLQYVSRQAYQGEPRYIFGKIQYNLISFSFRFNYFITPDLSIQYWGQPFIASGKYSEFKHITNARAAKFSDRFHVYETDRLQYNEGIWAIDETGDGTTDYRFRHPEFKKSEFLSNLVLRWEFKPGSNLYLVWSQNRSAFDDSGSIIYLKDMDYMFSRTPHNIFLLKFSWRLGMKV